MRLARPITPKGDPLHKTFIRTPVAFTRISSRFGFRRDPVLNRIRSHKGVDYAASEPPSRPRVQAALFIVDVVGAMATRS